MPCVLPSLEGENSGSMTSPLQVSSVRSPFFCPSLTRARVKDRFMKWFKARTAGFVLFAWGHQRVSETRALAVLSILHTFETPPFASTGLRWSFEHARRARKGPR
eukprot:scaffold1088_cov247-Pinguiococcus_pyrenoidosus.AAC.4